MRGSEGKFMPTELVTKGQLITILVRALEGMQDETTTPRYQAYYDLAVELDITNDSLANMDRFVPRQE